MFGYANVSDWFGLCKQNLVLNSRHFVHWVGHLGPTWANLGQPVGSNTVTCYISFLCCLGPPTIMGCIVIFGVLQDKQARVCAILAQHLRFVEPKSVLYLIKLLLYESRQCAAQQGMLELFFTKKLIKPLLRPHPFISQKSRGSVQLSTQGKAVFLHRWRLDS